MYVDVILFVMCKAVMHTDFVIYQFARNIIRSGVCNIILHAEIEYKRNHDLCVCMCVCVYMCVCVCVCVHSGVQHTLCCVFALFYFV
jgi:hypothetical protein